MVEDGGPLDEVAQLGSLTSPPAIPLVGVPQRDARLVSQTLDSADEVELLHRSHEADRVSVLLAPEAVVEAFGFLN